MSELLGLPPQSAPPFAGVAPLMPDGTGADLSKVLINKALWLFLYNIQKALTEASGFEPGGGPPSNGDVLTWVAANNDYEPVSPSVVPGAATIDYHTLTANATINASVMPAPTNGVLIVFVTQDATGHWTIIWDSTDFSIAPNQLSVLPNAKAVITFAADGAGKWAMAAPPMTR